MLVFDNKLYNKKDIAKNSEENVLLDNPDSGKNTIPQTQQSKYNFKKKTQ